MRILVLVISTVFLSGLLNPVDGQSQTGRLKVFVDCSDTRCDYSYFRTEINIIDFYRDRLAADVHVLITNSRNASQGRAYQMIFFGLNSLKGRIDTLRFNTNVNATDYEEREALLQHLKVGLLPYLLKSNKAMDIGIDMKAEEASLQISEISEEDKWDYWVFRLSADGSYNADAVYKNYRWSTRASADRVTEKSKVSFFYRRGQSSRSFEYTNDSNVLEKVLVENHDQFLNHEYVWSLNDHWSVGYNASYRDDTFSNYKSRIIVNPAIEYSIFPYEEFNNRFFTIRYSVGVWSSVYNDLTIYNKIKETRPRHTLDAKMNYNQKWGKLGIGLRWMNYLDDFSVNNLSLETDIEMRISGGLFFNINVDAGIVHDQLNLSKGDATEEEVLTERRQLQTDFDFRVGMGISYRFGSKLNNIVNPRFDD